jgi:surface antigen
MNTRFTVPVLSAVLLSGALALSGCGTTTTQRAGSGAALGAAGGALIGSLSADAGKGALIGAGVGALGGFLADQHAKGNID